MKKSLFLTLLTVVLCLLSAAEAKAVDWHYYLKINTVISPSSSGSAYVTRDDPDYNISYDDNDKEWKFDWNGKENTTIYLYAQPKPGFEFVAWKEGNTVISESPKCSRVVKGGLGSYVTAKKYTYTAVFERITEVLVNYDPSEFGSYSAAPEISIDKVKNKRGDQITGTTVRDSVLKPACISSNFAIKNELWTKLNYTGRFLRPFVVSVRKGNSHPLSMPTVRPME